MTALSRVLSASLLVTAVLAVSACGGGVDPPDAASPGTDAGMDAAVAIGDDGGSANDVTQSPDVTVLADAPTPPPPDAGPPDGGAEPCAAEGMFRRVPCACGGTQSERCMAGVWTVAVACDRATSCTPGAFETREFGYCGVQQRECPDGCAWTEWVTVVPPGPCHPDLPPSCGPGPPPINCACRADCTCAGIEGCPYPVGRP